jgi:hypothetical protein
MQPQSLFPVLAAFVLTLASLGAEAQTTPVRVRGSITGFDGSVLAVKTRQGRDVTVKLAETFAVIGVAATSMAEIKSGSFIGTGAVQDKAGRLVALEVLVFPESSRGSNEGHYPWDLQPGSTMTNATVAALVDENDGKELTLTYKGGQQRVVVPKGIPIVTFVPADRSLLVPGAQVVIATQMSADGSMSAARVLVGKDGITPPM